MARKSKATTAEPIAPMNVEGVDYHGWHYTFNPPLTIAPWQDGQNPEWLWIDFDLALSIYGQDADSLLVDLCRQVQTMWWVHSDLPADNSNRSTFFARVQRTPTEQFASVTGRWRLDMMEWIGRKTSGFSVGDIPMHPVDETDV